jgi:Cation efflux family
MVHSNDHHVGHDHGHAGHDHDHGGHDHHDHGGLGHVHAPASFGKAFVVGMGLNAAFVVLEVVFGIASNSVALLADAGHNLSDALGLGGAWAAVILAKRTPTARFTYGLGGTSILTALAFCAAIPRRPSRSIVSSAKICPLSADCRSTGRIKNPVRAAVHLQVRRAGRGRWPVLTTKGWF